MSVQERDPCPHRIFDDIGGAFAMGAIGGGVWNSVKGARNSPRGERLLGSVTAVKARAPVIGGAPRPLAQHSSTLCACCARAPTVKPDQRDCLAESLKRRLQGTLLSGEGSSPRSTARWWRSDKRRTLGTPSFLARRQAACLLPAGAGVLPAGLQRSVECC